MNIERGDEYSEKSLSFPKSILLLGKHTPTLKQAGIVKKEADDSFMPNLSNEFFEQISDELPSLPQIAGWAPAIATATALRLKCVESHTDDWVGPGDYDVHASLFWVFEGSLRLHVGADACDLQRGDYVLFLDNIMHSVYASRLWRAVAIQMRPQTEESK